MVGQLSGMLGFLFPGVLGVALVCAGDTAPAIVHYAGSLFLLVSALLAALWCYAFWAFHLATVKAPRCSSCEEATAEPRIMLEWSASDEFPEDFAPLLALKQLMFVGEGISGALVEKLELNMEIHLRPGGHKLKVSSKSQLELLVPSSGKQKCQLVLRAKPPTPQHEAVATHLQLDLPGVQLAGVAGALDSIWDLWASAGESSTSAAFGPSFRWLCVLLLRLLETALPIQLFNVEGVAAGDQFLLFFSGLVGPIPFQRIHLPTFLLPRLHAPLRRLLSPNPLVGQKLHHSAPLPVAHPALLAAWNLSVDAWVSPVGLDVALRLRDGSFSTFHGMLLSEGRTLRLRCQSSGSLDNEELRLELQSFSVSSNKLAFDASGSRGVRGNASVVVGLGRGVRSKSATKERQVSGSPETLPELLYVAACRGTLEPASLDVQCSMSLADGSELPEPLRLTFRDEHPLMLGSANVAAQLQRLALRGSAALRQDLPMQRKRDLLQLPTADFSFEAALSLEEETSFVDDGFSTVRFRGVEGTADGRLWSASEDCLQTKVDVHIGGILALKARAASFVQALIEAETAAARLSGSKPRSTDATLPRPKQSETIGADEDAPYTSVRAGDVVFLEVGGSAVATAAGKLRLFPVVLDGASSPVSRGRREAEKLAVADIDLHVLDGDSRMPMLRASLAGSEAKMELGEFRAQVGDFALTIPSRVKVKVSVVEAEINAEGIGQTHLKASWDGLGQPLLQHTAKQRSVLFPQPPSASGFTVRIGDMGQMGITLDDEPDAAECGNRLLDDEAWFSPLLELAATMNLEPAVKRVLNLSRVVRNVLRSEGIDEPKDVIPAHRMARVIARILQEIGTDGQHVADEAPTKLELDIRGVVQGAVDGKGLDVAKITRLLWDHLPSEACTFVQEYTAEVDFVIKWFDSVLRPTEPTSGPDPSKANEPPPSQKFRRDLEEVAPCASRLYEAVERPALLSRTLEDQLRVSATYLTAKQVEHVLRSSHLEPSLRHRLKFLLGLKRRVEKVAQGYGGPAFMPQGMAVGFFLATAIRASFATGQTAKASLPPVPSQATSLSARLASILREQKAVATELCHLQERQRILAEEALQLAGLSDAEPQIKSGPSRMEERPSEPREVPSSMLTYLAPQGLPQSHAAAISANAARHAQSQAAATSKATPSNVPSLSRSEKLFDLGTSLMGPMEVAILLQSGLAAVPQGRQVQQNQRMLLEMMVSQPPLFLKGVLYELSNNGSSRVLGNHLLALLDLKQDAVRPGARLDVADLLTQALGVSMPRRSDFMAGGSSASRSYLLLVHRAAKQVLEECEPYVALKNWLQRAEVPLPTVRDVPLPSAQSAIVAAQQSIKEADLAGAAWLAERGPVWYDGCLEEPQKSLRGDKEPELRAAAERLYLAAFKACSTALEASQEVLREDWLHAFWARNYDALVIISVLRNVQMDVDETRKWLDAQLRHASKTAGWEGISTVCDLLWSTNPISEACLVDCLIEVLFYEPADRRKYRSDSLITLIMDEPPGPFDFTVVSAMGVITEGAKGTEMAATYTRLQQLRGVEVVRADTATLQSVDYNAACVERAVRENVQTPWGWVGYSQGCANAFRAEAMMLQGTPEQQRLMENFRCRQLLYSAANGSAHATCGDWKLLRALVDGERFLKRFQASMSVATQNLALDLLQNAMSSRLAYAVLGSVQSLTHQGARTMWRDGQHCPRAPSTSIRGVVEDHTIPECLMMLSNVILEQMDYSQRQDTQVAVEEAVAHPTSIRNANAELLKQVDIRSAIQRTHHWSPLREEVLFLMTAKDDPLGMFDAPKDRHVFPWLEVNARFGIIKRREASKGTAPQKAEVSPFGFGA